MDVVAVSILNDLLNFDKIETGTLKIEAEEVNIWDLVESTVNQFRIQAMNGRVELKLDMQKPTIPSPAKQVDDLEAGKMPCPSVDQLKVCGDDVRISQVLRNVISNALKFTPDQGTIHVSVAHKEDGLAKSGPLMINDQVACTHPRAGSIEVRVKDSGVGLAKDQLQQLFGEGVQFDANRLQHGGGSGLGLSIAKGIVEQHMGSIRAESEGHGHGTTFIVELPLHMYPTMDSTDVTSKSHFDSADSPSVTTTTVAESEKSVDGCLGPRPKRILVAEDAASSRKMLVRLLERAGHSCVAVEDGQQAVLAMSNDLAIAKTDVSHTPICTLLMDFEMPIMTGPEATKAIREIGFNGTIIGVTGNVLQEDVDFFKDHGANEVFSKPISMDRLKTYWDQQAESHRRRKR